MSWLALDIGGANLKAADGLGWARSVPIALWREPERLALVIKELLIAAPASHRLAVTMTGELCDAFRTKADGVRRILTSVAEAAAGREVVVYLVDGRIVSVDEARKSPYLAAACNWYALAQFACRFLDDKPGLLIDVGSTTTDIVPLHEGRVAARGASDIERLLAGELVYTGVGRTPLCAVTQTLPFRGKSCSVAAELFATTADVYVVLGEVAEQPEATWTADGRPLTRAFAQERLARMICADAMTFDEQDAHAAAEAVCVAQFARLRSAVEQVAAGMRELPHCIIVCGTGEFLAARLVEDLFGRARLVSLTTELGTEVSTCAPAHALAVLTREAES